jgi:hypothetical protein
MSTQIPSVDVPQQDDLVKIRAVVAALKEGVPATEMRGVAGLTQRHVRYTLHAARVLGWVTEDNEEWSATEQGAALLGHEAGSGAERSCIRSSVEQSRVLQSICPELLGRRVPSVEQLADRLGRIVALSPSTAQRRALTLVAWHEQIVTEPQTPSVADTKPDAAVSPAALETVEEEDHFVEEVTVEPIPGAYEQDPDGQMTLF